MMFTLNNKNVHGFYHLLSIACDSANKDGRWGRQEVKDKLV
jgi:hypothetical protein